MPAIAQGFAIESGSPRAIESARTLFAPWLLESADIEIARQWRVDEDESAEQKYSVAEVGESYLLEENAERLWNQRPIVELLTQIEYASLSHLIAHLPPEFIGLHGALLSREFDGVRRAVIIVGPKEAGKSTTACALWKAGWTLHCDDFTLLDASSAAYPTARRVSLRAGSRELLGEELWQSALQTPSARPAHGGVLFHPHEIENQECAHLEALSIGAICFLKRRDIETAPAQSAPLGGIEAALALLPYSNLLLAPGTFEVTPGLGDWGAQLAKIATLTADIALYDLGRGPTADMVREIERLVAATAPVPSR